MRQHSTSWGFTLIEILMVVSLIAILASIIIIAINPVRHFAEAKNAQRWSHVNAILNSVYEYSIDHGGALPASFSAVPVEICKSGTSSSICSSNGLLDLSPLSPAYLAELPVDPAELPGFGTGYLIATTTEDRVIVSAPHAEEGDTISVGR